VGAVVARGPASAAGGLPGRLSLDGLGGPRGTGVGFWAAKRTGDWGVVTPVERAGRTLVAAYRAGTTG
jgi:hypothetical protein